MGDTVTYAKASTFERKSHDNGKAGRMERITVTPITQSILQIMARNMNMTVAEVVQILIKHYFKPSATDQN